MTRRKNYEIADNLKGDPYFEFASYVLRQSVEEYKKGIAFSLNRQFLFNSPVGELFMNYCGFNKQKVLNNLKNAKVKRISIKSVQAIYCLYKTKNNKTEYELVDFSFKRSAIEIDTKGFKYKKGMLYATRTRDGEYWIFRKIFLRKNAGEELAVLLNEKERIKTLCESSLYQLSVKLGIDWWLLYEIRGFSKYKLDNFIKEVKDNDTKCDKN